jgi:hypothetical protein
VCSFSLLVSGDTFLGRRVEILPRFKDSDRQSTSRHLQGTDEKLKASKPDAA